MPQERKPEKLPITVPQSLHDAMVQATSEGFAVSYLCGAILDHPILRPRTGIAKERLEDSISAMRVLDGQGIKLGEPLRPQERVPLPGASGPALAAARPWRPATADEYERLSVRGKIDHHTNMAHRAYMEAGPQWGKGKPIPSGEMPSNWHEKIDVAKSHQREAKRLRAMIVG